MARLTFEERNKNNYTKYSDVPIKTINKYKGVLPEELLTIWQNMGYGIYEDGFIQFINPDEYEFVFDYIDKLLEPSIVFGVTALGDLLIWEGNDNWTISSDEGNRILFINIRKCTSEILGDMDFLLNFTLGDETAIIDKEYFDSRPYLTIKGKLPTLQYGQCYGYVPALALGGKASSKNLQVVDIKSYVDIIGQAVGKFIDLSDKKNMDKEERINQITKQVKILERVPLDKRIEVFNRGAKNIYVVGSILLLIFLWIVILGSTILEMEPLWQLNRGLMRNTWNIIGKLFFPIFLPCIFIIGIPIEIRNYIIKRIVDKEYPLKTEK